MFEAKNVIHSNLVNHNQTPNQKISHIKREKANTCSTIKISKIKKNYFKDMIKL